MCEIHKYTELLLHNGSIKKAKDLNIGDVLWSHDQKTKIISSITKDKGKIYTISPSKTNMEPYKVSENCMIILRATGVSPYVRKTPYNTYRLCFYRKCVNYCNKYNCSKKAFHIFSKTYKSEDKCYKKLEKISKKDYFVNSEEIFKMTANEYFNVCTDDVKKTRLKCFQIPLPIVISNSFLPLDPYFLGIWLGDGKSNHTRITSADKEIEEYLYKFIDLYPVLTIKKETFDKGAISNTGIKSSHEYHNYSIISQNNQKINPIIDCLRKLNLYNNKHIPDIYLNSSKDNRLKLLAGLLDTDGYLNPQTLYYHFSQSEVNYKLSEDYIKLIRSLGFCNYTKTICKVKSKNGTYRDGKLYHENTHIIIRGGDIYSIPCLIKRKNANNYEKRKNINNLNSAIKITLSKKTHYIRIEFENQNGYILSKDCTIIG